MNYSILKIQSYQYTKTKHEISYDFADECNTGNRIFRRNKSITGTLNLIC